MFALLLLYNGTFGGKEEREVKKREQRGSGFVVSSYASLDVSRTVCEDSGTIRGSPYLVTFPVFTASLAESVMTFALLPEITLGDSSFYRLGAISADSVRQNTWDASIFRLERDRVFQVSSISGMIERVLRGRKTGST